MTLPDNPISTLWLWAARAPVPVIIAACLLFGGWTYRQVAKQDSRITEQEKALAEMSATLKQVDTNVQTLLQAVLWENQSHQKKENH